MTVDADLQARRRLLEAALAAARLGETLAGGPRVLAECRRWLDRWTGVGHVAAGMARQGFDLQLTRFGDEGWRATFYPAGRAHSDARGTAWEATPWQAVRRAAWQALGRRDAGPLAPPATPGP